MLQQARAVETRATIISGAANVFQTKGYLGTSMTDICAFAGVTKGALYFHFTSKEDIALAVIAAQHEASISIVNSLRSADISGLEALLIMSVELAKQIMNDPVVSAGIRLTMEAANFSVPVISPYTDWITVCEEFLRRAINDGDVSPTENVETIAHFIIPAFTGVQLVSDVLTYRQDLFRRIEEMWSVLLPALVPAARLPLLKDLPKRVSTDRLGMA